MKKTLALLFIALVLGTVFLVASSKQVSAEYIPEYCMSTTSGWDVGYGDTPLSGSQNFKCTWGTVMKYGTIFG